MLYKKRWAKWGVTLAASGIFFSVASPGSMAATTPKPPTSVTAAENAMAVGWLKSHGPVAHGQYVPLGGHQIAGPAAFNGQFADTQNIPSDLLPQNPKYYIVHGQLINGQWQYPFTPLNGGGVNLSWLEIGVNNSAHLALYEVGTVSPAVLKPSHTNTTNATASTSYVQNVAWGLTARWDNVGNPIFAVLDQVTWDWNNVYATDVSHSITSATWNQIPYYYYDFFHDTVTYSSGGYYEGSAAWFSWPDDYDYWSPISNTQYTDLANNTANASTIGTVNNPETGSTIAVKSIIHGGSDGNYWYTSSSPCTGVACGLLNAPNVYYDLSSGYILA